MRNNLNKQRIFYEFEFHYFSREGGGHIDYYLFYFFGGGSEGLSQYNTQLSNRPHQYDPGGHHFLFYNNCQNSNLTAPQPQPQLMVGWIQI